MARCSSSLLRHLHLLRRMTPRAKTIDETYRSCNPDQPLPPDDDRYVDLTESRGMRQIAKLKAAQEVLAAISGTVAAALPVGDLIGKALIWCSKAAGM